MDELFYDKWVLRLLMRYAATFVSKDEFLSWCRLTMAQDIKDQPWNIGRALKMIEDNFAKWEAFASSRQSALFRIPLPSANEAAECLEALCGYRTRST